MHPIKAMFIEQKGKKRSHLFIFMSGFGTTPEQMAWVAVKNRLHASLNPMAQFREPVTVEEILASPMIADPLTRLQCCPIADGTAAVVLCSKQAAASIPGALRGRAWAHGTGDYHDPLNIARWATRFGRTRTSPHYAACNRNSTFTASYGKTMRPLSLRSRTPAFSNAVTSP